MKSYRTCALSAECTATSLVSRRMMAEPKYRITTGVESPRRSKGRELDMNNATVWDHGTYVTTTDVDSIDGRTTIFVSTSGARRFASHGDMRKWWISKNHGTGRWEALAPRTEFAGGAVIERFDTWEEAALFAWDRDNRVTTEAPSLIEFLAINVALSNLREHRHIDANGFPRGCRNPLACAREAVEWETEVARQAELEAARFMPLPYEDPYVDPIGALDW